MPSDYIAWLHCCLTTRGKLAPFQTKYKVSNIKIKTALASSLHSNTKSRILRLRLRSQARSVQIQNLEYFFLLILKCRNAHLRNLLFGGAGSSRAANVVSLSRVADLVKSQNIYFIKCWFIILFDIYNNTINNTMFEIT